MYKVAGLTYQCSTEEMGVVKKWIGLTGAEDFQIYNLPTYNAQDIGHNTIVVAFGKIATYNAEQQIEDKKLTNVKVITLPVLDNLTPIQENQKDRQGAAEKLKAISELLKKKQYYPTELEIKEADLPEISKREALILEKLTEDKDETSCFQTSINGRLVEITSQLSANSPADIQITFNELYTLRCLMDLLDVKEVTIVRSDQTNNPLDNQGDS